MINDPMEQIIAYLDGELSADDAAALEAWLVADPANMEAFVRLSRVHWQMYEELSSQAPSPVRAERTTALSTNSSATGQKSITNLWGRWKWVAAASVLAIAMAGVGYLVHQGGKTGRQESTFAVATLTAVQDAVWEDGAVRPPGLALEPGRLGLREGCATITFKSGAVTVLRGNTHFEVLNALSGRLALGRLQATVPYMAHGFRVEIPQAAVVDLGTKFDVVVNQSGNSEIRVQEGVVEVDRDDLERTRLTQGQALLVDVSAGRARFVPLSGGSSQAIPTPSSSAKPAPASRPAVPSRPAASAAVGGARNVYQERFLAMWKTLHDAGSGYFSPEGVPYHSVETFLIEAPDYGHETTSETMSYWLWLEAKYGHLSGDWSKLDAAWECIEKHAIPTHEDQPTNSFYNPSKAATFAPEYETPAQYPAPMWGDIPVGRDTLAEELKKTYGTPDVYGMHWLIDVDNWYGYGRRGDGTSRPSFINTFQRGPMESVWATVPQPSWDNFKFGGRNGYLDLFIRDNNYARQWRYTTAPDADARAVQAMYWASQWAARRNQSVKSPVEKASRLGDYLRYAFFDKYFKKLGAGLREGGSNGPDGKHYLLSWYYAWGGSADTNGGWAWRISCSHIHSGYQNPMAAWVLSETEMFRPKSPSAARDWRTSLSRQLEFYRWLQSAEGAIAGGATNSVNGRYDKPPADASRFYNMTYDWQPVYHDPPSNNWFGMQTWTMGRVAELYYVTGNPQAGALLDKWVPWAMSNVKLTEDGGYAVPQALKWTGQPDPWNPASPGANANLHVEVVDRNADVGVAASLARTLLYYSAGKKRWARAEPLSAALAREILDHMWNRYRDDKGVSAPEERGDYRRVFEQEVFVPQGWSGKMPNGDELKPGMKFIDLRSRYRGDPAFEMVRKACEAGKAPVFRYHRFWAQAEIALANAAVAELDTDDPGK